MGILLREREEGGWGQMFEPGGGGVGGSNGEEAMVKCLTPPPPTTGPQVAEFLDFFRLKQILICFSIQLFWRAELFARRGAVHCLKTN